MSYLVKNYNRKKISFQKGKGSYLYSTKGVKYLDFCSGIAVNSLGHANNTLTKVLNAQAKKVWMYKCTQYPEKNWQKISEKNIADYVMFQNSVLKLLKLQLKLQEDIFLQ